jgi:hypothetical protein
MAVGEFNVKGYANPFDLMFGLVSPEQRQIIKLRKEISDLKAALENSTPKKAIKPVDEPPLTRHGIQKLEAPLLDALIARHLYGFVIYDAAGRKVLGPPGFKEKLPDGPLALVRHYSSNVYHQDTIMAKMATVGVGGFVLRLYDNRLLCGANYAGRDSFTAVFEPFMKDGITGKRRPDYSVGQASATGETSMQAICRAALIALHMSGRVIHADYTQPVRNR